MYTFRYTQSEELNYAPEPDDPAFEAGFEFVKRNRDSGDNYIGDAPQWFGWMVRQAFWCGVRWGRRESESKD